MRNQMKLNARSRSRTAAVLRVGIALALGATLAACVAQREKSVRGWLVADPSERHPIHVGNIPVSLDLAVPVRGYGLTQPQTYELRYFLRGHPMP